MAALLTCLGLAAAEPSPNDRRLLTADLRADASVLPAGAVLVLLVSLPDCHWCHDVRAHYLLPLLADAVSSADLSVREINLGGDGIRDFDGDLKPVDAIVARWSVKAAPTLLFLDACGRSLAEPLVGGDVAGFYAAYLDRALADARVRSRSVRLDC